jgi:hypothetical protein
MRAFGRRWTWAWIGMSIALVLGFGMASGGLGADDPPPSPVEVEEWSIWVTNPALTASNGTRVYKNAMASVVGTSRPKFDEKELAGKFPIAPISVVQFFGEPTKDVDIELRVKKGTFLAHWPPATERGGRLQWFKSNLWAAPPPTTPPSYLPETHWFQKLRSDESARYLSRESQFERFVAYDAELAISTPVKLRGGPDEFTVQNLTARKLLDVAIIAPTDAGYRVGWLDELPAAAEKADDAPKKKKDDEAAKKKTEAQKAEAVFQDSGDKPKAPEMPPLPAEGDATVRAQVDPVLNRPVTVAVEKAPRKDVLDLIASQARLRYELDDRAIAKAQVKIGELMSLNAAGLAARDALADVLGPIGLSYRVTTTGVLFITTAERLAEDANKKGSAIEGPPIKLTLSQPLKPSNPSYRELTSDAYLRRLTGRGLRESVAKFLIEQYGSSLFEPGELIVLAHFSRDAIDDLVLLDVFPAPKKMTRVAAMVVHGIDPRLQDRARSLVLELGDRSPGKRDSAEARLFAMGPAAVPVLEDALTQKDIEIVFRAERLLMRLNRPVP